MIRRWQPGEPVSEVAALLARGGVLAIPTESSYGLGVLPDHRRGVEAVYEVKGRPADKALPVVVGEVAALAELGVDPGSAAVRSASRLWPGPLTVVVPCERPLAATAGASTLAVRVPGHPGLRELLVALGGGLTATSANPSGSPSVREPERLDALLEGCDAMIYAAGPCPGGPPSTIVRWVGDRWELLREGRLDRAALTAAGLRIAETRHAGAR